MKATNGVFRMMLTLISRAYYDDAEQYYQDGYYEDDVGSEFQGSVFMLRMTIEDSDSKNVDDQRGVLENQPSFYSTTVIIGSADEILSIPGSSVVAEDMPNT